MPLPGEEIRRIRIEKLENLKKLGVDPYPEKSKFFVDSIKAVADKFSVLVKRKKVVGIAGRVMAKREHGGSMFLDLFDGTGKFQVFAAENTLKNTFSELRDVIDIGDIISVQGKLFRTKQKQQTISAHHWQILVKSLRPLPEKWHGISDAEERFRKRYLDLMMNDGVRARFLLRSNIINAIRRFFNDEGFLEVETPMLHSIPGGALARPFITHHNALDQDFYLRVAPELYLKRLLIGGFQKIFEIGRNFRNEGIDHNHNPEFTMLEAYSAYETRAECIDMVHKFLLAIAKSIFHKTFFTYQGASIDCKKHAELSFSEALERHALLPQYDKASRSDFELAASRFGISIKPSDTKSKIADIIFKKIVRPKLIQPTFLLDHPLEISPLAKRNPARPHTALRFQLIVGGQELVNGFSELNDPLDQAERFKLQEALKNTGEAETMSYDGDFIEALEYGMPPAAGIGIGIDRLIMLLTDSDNIKEVILFPTLRSKM